MKKPLPKHLSKKSIALQSLLVKKRQNDWKNKPASWPDMRNDAQEGHIYLLADTRYPIGFVATATGGYSVAIDGEHYGDYASNAQFAMADWAEYIDTEGYDISEPTGATKAHIIDIYPQTESENITQFSCARVADSGTEYQGVLWVHFNLSNSINISGLLLGENSRNNYLTKAITALNNTLQISSSLYNSFRTVAAYASLTYLPVLDADNSSINANSAFYGQKLIKDITIKNATLTGNAIFYSASTLSNIKGSPKVAARNLQFYDCRNLKKFPNLDFSSSTDLGSFIYQVAALEDTVLDARAGTGITRIGCYGTSTYFMPGFKGLRVSNEAPFTGTAPQINVSYTGMDRNALVQLFNDLPIVSDGQIINIVGCTGASDLTADDELIATAKGWTLTR